MRLLFVQLGTAFSVRITTGLVDPSCLTKRMAACLASGLVRYFQYTWVKTLLTSELAQVNVSSVVDRKRLVANLVVTCK